MQAEFRAPRRRNRVQEDFEASLPVSHSSRKRAQLRAELINQHVLVCRPEDIQKIYSQGYFGKGILSKARPDHSISDQWEYHEGLLFPVISSSSYRELLQWARAFLSAQGWDNEAISQMMTNLSRPVQIEDVKKEVDGECPVVEGGVGPFTKRPRSEVNPKAKRSCSDPDSEHVVSGAGFVLVVFEEEVRELRRIPVPVTEYLQLSLEEAFFLVYGLGCLSVCLNQEPLSILQLWKTFRAQRPDFVCSYAAYHYFRCKGWVPKGGGGAKYGVDFMLYRKGPPFYHASYSVVVQPVNSEYKGTGTRPFTWRSLAALNRITTNVSKELLFCYVVFPANLSDAELESPQCLSRLKVQEVIVSRWISSRERAEQDDI
ncbi:tRNA-splicing endonuclease subunit Sen2 isoform X2 [Cynoglossus semilaevis]|uniref:tRNA-splicing endonuclease subunit Sen2 isoform X2 n=1 Tax=Cynoglossus semilaevis TaxID=244447 RepID=UPI0004966230|nr:tRNA-splicing endonuclease subunit Sen2 isoform X2 [Cynoglossus semilaevis]